jgi:hypothetical protein
MDKQLPRDQDDLSDFERRLSEWRPQADGLTADAMLYAAGLAAAGRRTSRLWPALCAVLLAQVAGLGAWGISQRSERLALAKQLDGFVSSPVATATAVRNDAAHRGYSPSPNDYLQQRRRMEHDASFNVAAASPGQIPVFEPEFPQAAIPRAGQWSDLLD